MAFYRERPGTQASALQPGARFQPLRPGSAHLLFRSLLAHALRLAGLRIALAVAGVVGPGGATDAGQRLLLDLAAADEAVATEAQRPGRDLLEALLAGEGNLLGPRVSRRGAQGEGVAAREARERP